MPSQTTKPVTFVFMRSHIAHWFSLGFGCGLSPVAPGTVATLWAWLVFNWWLYPTGLSPTSMGLFLLLAFVLGMWSSKKTAKELNIPDPGAIVWDEIVAFWFLLWILDILGLGPSALEMQAAAFVLFRCFDAMKWGPVVWADQHFKGFGWRGAFGIMLDDIIAALMALLPLLLWRYWGV